MSQKMPQTIHRAFIVGCLFSSIFLVACPVVPPADAGIVDGGMDIDAGNRDAGNRDGGNNRIDSGKPLLDGGSVFDAGDVENSCFEFAFPFENPPQAPANLTPNGTWKTRISRTDSFVAATPFGVEPSLQWVKFAVLPSDPTFVIFQDSNRYPFHYEFASENLPGFVGMSVAEFNDVTLHEEGQELILGAMVFPTNLGGGAASSEIGIQFVRQDPMHPQQVVELFDLVKSALDDVEGVSFLYFPTFEQQCAAENYASYFSGEGVSIGGVDRWSEGDGCYVPGWSIGRLHEVASDDIQGAYLRGDLLPTDILVTDFVPSEIPFVAGVVSFSSSTPNSHVAILAAQYEKPFVHARLEASADRVRALLGKEVALEASGGFSGGCTLRILDLSEVDRALIDPLLSAREPPPVAVVAKQALGETSADVQDLGPADLEYFGGKASMFGLLRDVIPENSPDAQAFSFDLFDEFMAQPFSVQDPSGPTLGARINEKLAAYVWPPNFAELSNDLATIRTWIKEASFPEARQAEVFAALSRFNANKKIRIRSSTNVEDSVSFVGAGLYDSKSGCLADDLDDDETGPSLCNETKADERGIFRAMQIVYGSFYNENAFHERLRRGVDESEVGMALLAHHSFPDDDELANGVATLSVGQFSTSAILVSQFGATSVTNPNTSATPEVMSAYISGDGENIYPSLEQASSLVPIGQRVLLEESRYTTLIQLLLLAKSRFVEVLSPADNFKLDFEYKWMRTEGLIIKQIRQLPISTTSTETFRTRLLDDDVEFCVFQGEQGTILGNHRMKSKLRFAHDDVLFDPDALTQSIFGDGSFTFLASNPGEENPVTLSLSGDVNSWPASTWTHADETISQSFSIEGGRTYTLQVELENEVLRSRMPFKTLQDARIGAVMDYDTAQVTLGYNGENGPTTLRDYVALQPCNDVSEPAPRSFERDFVVEDDAVSARVHMWYPPGPTGAGAGYTAPLYKWEDITLTGFTSSPMVLKSDWSRSFRPEHHNFSEHFLFEPHLDDNVTVEQKQELQAAGIESIYVQSTYPGGFILVAGDDGIFTPLAAQ